MTAERMTDQRLEAIRQRLNTSKAATCEQEARDLLNTLGYPDALNLSAGDVVELANLLRDMHYLVTRIDTLQRERDTLQHFIAGFHDAGISLADFRDDLLDLAEAEHDRAMAAKIQISRLIDALRTLSGSWREEGQIKGSFHATMGTGWNECAKEIDRLITSINRNTKE